jgi:hypothetical protein
MVFGCIGRLPETKGYKEEKGMCGWWLCFDSSGKPETTEYDKLGEFKIPNRREARETSNALRYI